jgi:hypothetical protein
MQKGTCMSPQPDDDLLWRIAIHEAGHSVAARLMGLPCGAASIVAPDPHAMFARNCGAESIVALMAGAISEALGAWRL